MDTGSDSYHLHAMSNFFIHEKVYPCHASSDKCIAVSCCSAITTHTDVRGGARAQSLLLAALIIISVHNSNVKLFIQQHNSYYSMYNNRGAVLLVGHTRGQLGLWATLHGNQ